MKKLRVFRSGCSFHDLCPKYTIEPRRNIQSFIHRLCRIPQQPKAFCHMVDLSLVTLTPVLLCLPLCFNISHYVSFPIMRHCPVIMSLIQLHQQNINTGPGQGYRIPSNHYRFSTLKNNSGILNIGPRFWVV